MFAFECSCSRSPFLIIEREKADANARYLQQTYPWPMKRVQQWLAIGVNGESWKFSWSFHFVAEQSVVNRL